MGRQISLFFAQGAVIDDALNSFWSLHGPSQLLCRLSFRRSDISPEHSGAVLTFDVNHIHANSIRAGNGQFSKFLKGPVDYVEGTEDNLLDETRNYVSLESWPGNFYSGWTGIDARVDCRKPLPKGLISLNEVRAAFGDFVSIESNPRATSAGNF